MSVIAELALRCLVCRCGECSELRKKSNTRVALLMAHSITTKTEPIIVFMLRVIDFKAKAHKKCRPGCGVGAKLSARQPANRTSQILREFEGMGPIPKEHQQ